MWFHIKHVHLSLSHAYTYKLTKIQNVPRCPFKSTIRTSELDSVMAIHMGMDGLVVLSSIMTVVTDVSRFPLHINVIIVDRFS